MPTIDFSGAYRDSTRGSTLKALALRRAEMQASMEDAMKPRQIASPWQGAAQLAQTVSGGIREGRLANQEAAGRARFAQLLAGGLSPDEIGEAMGLDPETTMKYQERTWAKEDLDAAAKRRQDELVQGHGWDVDAAAARVEAERAAATQQQGATAGLQEDQQAATLTLADKNASIDEKQAAQKVLDDIKLKEKQSEIDIEEAKKTAGFEDPAAKVKLAVENGALTPEEGKARIDAINAKAANEAMSPGLEEQNKKFAVDALDWKQQGAANIKTQVSQMKSALDTLETMKTQGAWDSPGRLMGTAEKVLPSWAMPWVGQDTMKARDSIRSAVQSSLKAVLGTQFAAVEGEQLLERAFSTSMDPAENIRRAKLVMDQVQQIAANKQAMVDYYDSHNSSLAGYQGPALDASKLTMMDFGDSSSGANAPAADGGATDAPAEQYQEGDVVSSPGQPDLVLKDGKWVPVQ